MFRPFALRTAAIAGAILAYGAASSASASSLTLHGITYDLTASLLDATDAQFTLVITGINGATDDEGGRYGVDSFAFNKPSNFVSATPPSGFSVLNGGLNSSGCDGSGNFFCFKSNTPVVGPALPANTSLTYIFDVAIASGTFANYLPDFKINWDGTKNNYDLVSLPLDPTFVPLPGALMMLAPVLVAGLLGMSMRRKSLSA